MAGDKQNIKENRQEIKPDIDESEDRESVPSELFYDGETEQEINSTLPYKLILGLIVLSIALFFLYIFISALGKH